MTNLDPRTSIISAANQFYQFGWLFGTAGNLSARLPDQSIWITASGKHKGELEPDDFIKIGLDGAVLEKPQPDLRPSAETSIHLAIYNLFPAANACYHVHSVNADLVSNFTDQDRIILPPVEMLKALGIWIENPLIYLAIFPNHYQVPKIASEIKQRFSEETPQLSVLLIRDHGITVWGDSPTTTRNYVEAIQYIFTYMVESKKMKLIL